MSLSATSEEERGCEPLRDTERFLPPSVLTPAAGTWVRQRSAGQEREEFHDLVLETWGSLSVSEAVNILSPTSPIAQ